MSVPVAAGDPCLVCDLPLFPNNCRSKLPIPAGHVMHRARHVCATCYSREERRMARARALAAGPITEERVADSLTKQRLPVGPLLIALAMCDLHKLNTPLWRAIERGKKHGYVSVASADRIAVRILSSHPAEIWGEAWWEAAS